jgi:3-phenylpropionate/cinnamic acid dioxygenase small subunit
MKIRLVTDRVIDDRDIDIWLRLYRDQCRYPIDIEKFKTEKVASWSEDQPDVRSRATTTIAIVEG